MRRSREPAGPSIISLWQATTVSVATSEGNRKTLAEADSHFNVTISATNLTMRLRDKLLADISYVLNAKPTPWAIDLKSADGVMLGIRECRGDRLRISLNDQAKGRPHNFQPQDNGMVLLLTRFPVRSLYMMNGDGSGRKRILTMWDNTITGSPDWSHDGKKIALDAWKSIYGEGVGDACMLVINVDGSGRKDLGPGYMPCWSLDDKQLAYSSHGPEQGICIMKADGSDRRCIDPEGWGTHWSPKRNEIAYTLYQGGRADLAFMTWASVDGAPCLIGTISRSPISSPGRRMAIGSPSKAPGPTGPWRSPPSAVRARSKASRLSCRRR